MKPIKDMNRMLLGGYRQPSDDKWWEGDSLNTVENYICELENIIDTLQRQISKIEGSSEYALSKSRVIAEFFRDITVLIAPDELVFLCLRLAGVRYAAISDIVGSMSQSDSTIQRKVERAKAKLAFHFRNEGNLENI